MSHLDSGNQFEYRPVLNEAQRELIRNIEGEFFGNLSIWQLESTNAVRAQMQHDIVQNGAVADSALRALSTIKTSDDHRWLLDEKEAMRNVERRIKHNASKTVQIVRAMSVGGAYPGELNIYLYASQYLFLTETTAGLAVEQLLYLAEALSNADRPRWGRFRLQQIKRPLAEKIGKLAAMGITFPSDCLDRSLRNSLAHGDFEV